MTNDEIINEVLKKNKDALRNWMDVRDWVHDIGEPKEDKILFYASDVNYILSQALALKDAEVSKVLNEENNKDEVRILDLFVFNVKKRLNLK